MPTYSYACTACEHRFDAVQAFTDSSLTECPECAGRLRKLFTPVGVVFKGSGFYRTDSRSGGGKDGERKDRKDSDGTGKPDSGSKAAGSKTDSSSGASGASAKPGSSSGSPGSASSSSTAKTPSAVAS